VILVPLPVGTVSLDIKIGGDGRDAISGGGGWYGKEEAEELFASGAQRRALDVVLDLMWQVRHAAGLQGGGVRGVVRRA
jgi:hypothetical protein